MLERPIEPNIDQSEDVSAVTTPLETRLPQELIENLPPLSENRIVTLTGTGTPATSYRILDEFRSQVDGFLVYVVNDVAANQANQILVSNSPATGDHNDDILTPGKSVLILAQTNRITVRNLSTNPHTVVVKAFRNWTPAYY